MQKLIHSLKSARYARIVFGAYASLLRWGSADLARHSGVGTATIKRMEVMDGEPFGQVRTIEALRSALEDAGVEFVGSPNYGPGVRLKLAGDK